jgi:hypothetical protein
LLLWLVEDADSRRPQPASKALEEPPEIQHGNNIKHLKWKSHDKEKEKKQRIDSGIISQ